MQFPSIKIMDEVFTLVKDSYLSEIIYWITDYRNQKISHKLPEFLKDMNLSEINNIIDEIPNESDYDKQVIACLRWVKGNITYKTDKEVYKVPEVWQTVEETLGLATGDCEDGALLLYWLCRRKGVPSNRLMIFCGDVSGGGHCWLSYRSYNYPINWLPLDWCYWYNANDIPDRIFHNIDGQKILELNTRYNRYYKIWFGFDQDNSYRSIRW
jgi:transglutaminase-like putative cysteine protease